MTTENKKILIIKALEKKHFDSVKKIYEQGIQTNNATFQTSAPDWDEWNKNHLTHSRLIAIMEDEIVGWAALTPVSGRCVYAGVAEVSVYVSVLHLGLGIGRTLLNNLILESEANGIWTLQAGIFPENLASIKLHESAGFSTLGTREKIGKMHGIWRDTLFLERRSKVIGI